MLYKKIHLKRITENIWDPSTLYDWKNVWSDNFKKGQSFCSNFIYDPKFLTSNPFTVTCKNCLKSMRAHPFQRSDGTIPI